MLKDWFGFLNAVSKNASRLLFFSTLLFIYPAFCEENADVLSNLPQVDIKVVQKNATGDQYQIGDRIPLFMELKPEMLQGQTALSVKPPEGGSKIEDQGWYIDPQTLFISNNLQFVVSPIQTGKLTLPTLLVLREDKTPIARTNAFSVQVVGPNPNDKNPPELISPIEVSLPWKYWFILGGISVASGLIIAYFIRRYLRYRLQTKPILLPKIKPDPEHTVALRALDALYLKYGYSPENLKPIAFGISEILKHFFSDRFKVDANEATTDEMIALLKAETLSSDQLREIHTFFHDLDLIKFTQHSSHSFGERHYHDFKIKAQSLIQKWTNHNIHPGASHS